MKTLLLVDDEPELLDALAELFALLFAEDVAAGRLVILRAAGGEEAVAVVQSSSVDMVIMDINLPGMDGVDTFLAIRELPGRRSPETLFLTGYAAAGTTAERMKQAIEAGAAGCLTKPVSAEFLAAAVSRILFPGREPA